MKIANVRLSFPSLFTKQVFDGKETKFGCQILIPKESRAAKSVTKYVKRFMKENKEHSNLPADRICLRDGDETKYDSHQDHLYLVLSSNVRPTVVDRRRNIIYDDDGTLYAGCYVNVHFELWAQDHRAGGKRINGEVLGVQFIRDGEPFGRGSYSADQFEDLGDDTSDEDDADAEEGDHDYDNREQPPGDDDELDEDEDLDDEDDDEEDEDEDDEEEEDEEPPPRRTRRKESSSTKGKSTRKKKGNDLPW
ncbi:MAG: DUF2815 family protein [Candidatus Poribacteria bacterium]|nr:DUF2815 family protein [Candidatus Poribacteria bacterium]